MTLDNICFEHTFSGTEDEQEFYRSNAGVELSGVELLDIIEGYQNLQNITGEGSINKISVSLQCVTNLLEDFRDILDSLYSGCNPDVFYWSIRPWFYGADADGPTSRRWIYEGVNEAELELSGPSGGQSTLMHTLDVWLGIGHHPVRRGAPCLSDENEKVDRGFVHRM